MLRRTLIAVALVLALPGAASAADLHATPSTFASQLAAAQGGDRVLLASGSYGSFPADTVKSSPGVTVTEESGAAATFGTSDFNSDTRWVTVQGVEFTGPVQVNAPANASMHLVFDGILMANVGQGVHEGRLSLNGPGTNAIGGNGVQIKNSTFGPGGCSDGIQDSSHGTEIGPGNEFKGLAQGCPESQGHVDSIQPYDGDYVWIHDNWIHDSEQGIMSPDGPSTGYLIENNVINMSATQNYYCMHLGDTSNATVRHNVCLNSGGIRPYGGNQGVNSTNVTVRDNVASVNTEGQCTNCTIDHNLTQDQVTFAGGTSARCNWATSSPKGTASDGTDIGLNDCGAPPPNPECSDGINNDPTEDTLIDYPADPGCSSATDNSEAGNPPPPPNPVCSDGADNDGDGLIDYPNDPGCSSAADTDETDVPVDHAPVARFTASPEPSTVGQTVTFDATTSTCQDTPCTYHWYDANGGTWPLGPDGQTSTIAFQSQHNAANGGPVQATLVVTDADGDTSTVEHDHTVNASNPPPDTTAPDTTITSAPSNGTSTSASVSFTGSDNVTPAGSLTFECRIDGGAYSACTSPKTYSGLSVGSHTVDVRAKDAAGNVDATPASATWTISSPPPPGGPPTFVASAQTSWTTTTTSKSVVVTVQPGDMLVAYTGGESSNSTYGISSSQQVISWGSTGSNYQGDATHSSASIWRATVPSTVSGSLTVNFNRSGNTGQWGGGIQVFRGSGGIGTVGVAVGTGAPSLTLANVPANSYIVKFNVDWAAVSGASRNSRTVGTFNETSYNTDSQYTVYAGYHSNIGAAGSKTIGYTAPSGQSYTLIGVVVLGT